MRYLLVNHIPAHAGPDPAHLRLPPAWARDLAAAGRAARQLGITLTLATPVTARPLADGVDVVPDATGFEHVALPGYDSARSFLQRRGAIEAALTQLIEVHDVIQLDHGGYPMPLGLLAAPIASAAGRAALWVVAGDRPPASRLARSAGTRAKRALGRTIDHRIRRTLTDALRSADAVVTTCAAVADALRDEAGVDATTIESLDVADDEIIGDAVLARRHARLLDAARPLRVAVSGKQTIDRGTEHVLAAVHRCWRLRAPVELVLDPAGGEADAVRRRVADLGLSIAVIYASDPAAFDTSDVWVDAALTNAARGDADRMIARGLAPIAYAPRRESPHVVALPRGDVDALAEAIFRAATDRPALAARALRGVAGARSRTLEQAHRLRFALAGRCAANPATTDGTPFACR